MLGCCSSFSREISLMAVLGTPSSSDSRRIFFMATISPVFRFLPGKEIEKLNQEDNPSFSNL